MYISLVTKVGIQRGKQKTYSFLIQFEEIKCLLKKQAFPNPSKGVVNITLFCLSMNYIVCYTQKVLFCTVF